MYNTVEELHIALDQSLQSVNSNRKNIIKREEKDWLLNETQIRVIDMIMDARKNNKGYEDDQLNYDMLLPVKKMLQIPVIPIAADRGVAILPSDYLHRDSINANVVFNCGEEIATTTSNKVVYELDLAPNGVAPYYDDFRIRINGSYVFNINDYGYENFNKPNSKFIIISLILDVFRDLGFDVYWERYKDNDFDFHSRNKLYLVPTTYTTPITDMTAMYNAEVNDAVVHTAVDTTNEVGEYNTLLNKPTSLISTELIDDMLNHKFYTTLPAKPLTTISKRLITVYYTDEWFVNSINLRYIQRPIFINSVAGLMTNLKNISDKIVQLTVQNIKAKIEANDYQAIVNENLINN